MVCATGKMICATLQNGLRLISKITDVLGKMICALVCAWFALDLRLVCATGVGVPVAQRKSFSSDQQSKVYKVLQPFLRKRSPTIGRGTPPALLHSRRTMLPFHL